MRHPEYCSYRLLLQSWPGLSRVPVCWVLFFSNRLLFPRRGHVSGNYLYAPHVVWERYGTVKYLTKAYRRQETARYTLCSLSSTYDEPDILIHARRAKSSPMPNPTLTWRDPVPFTCGPLRACIKHVCQNASSTVESNCNWGGGGCLPKSENN